MLNIFNIFIIFFLNLNLGCDFFKNNSNSIGSFKVIEDNGLDFSVVDNKRSALEIKIEKGNELRSNGSVLATIEGVIEGSIKELKKVLSLQHNKLLKVVDSAKSVFEYFVSDNRTDILQIDYLDDNFAEKTAYLELRKSLPSKVCFGLYLAGDNNLNGGDYSHSVNSDFVKNDLDELISVSFNNQNIQILVFLDTVAHADNFYKKTAFNEPGIYSIDNGQVTKLRTFKEPNMGHQDTFTFFLNTMHDYCDSDKYMLDIWSHGFSIFGVGFDESHYEDSLKPEELRRGIENSKLDKIDVLLFSACLMMDLGVLGELKDVVTTVVGSADYVPGDGSFYGNKISKGIIQHLDEALKEDANISSQDIGIIFGKTNYDSYFNHFQHGIQYHAHDFLTYSAVDMSNSNIDQIISAMKELIPHLSTDTLDLKQNKIKTYCKNKMLDLGNLAESIKDDPNFSSEAKLAAKKLYDSVKRSIVYIDHKETSNENDKAIGIGILYDSSRYSLSQNSIYKDIGWNKLAKKH